MKKIVDKKHIAILTYLCTVAYFASYFARSDFAAVLTAFISEEGVSAELAGLIITGAFFSYGIGQLLSGYLGDKIPPKWIVFGGFIMTGVMNLFMPLASGNITWMIVIWIVNGLAHAMMWPPMTKILTNYLSATAYVRSTTTVCVGASFGTLAVYLVSAWMVAVASWKSVMFIATGLAFVIGFVWLFMMSRIEKYVETHGQVENITLPEGKKHTITTSLKNVHWKRAILLIMLAIVFQGYLRDGIATWLPQYLQDVFDLNTSGSLLATILLPLFNVVIMEVCSWLYRNVLRNETLCAAVYFGVVAVMTVLLTVFFDTHVALSLALFIIANGAIHGINLILVCMISPHFQRYGKTSMMSGALNFCTYIGSGTATYTIALVFEHLGWKITIASWTALAILGAICCVAAIGLWRKFRLTNAE